MQSSVRAVEAYRRSRLIDGVTSDEDKVAPVYRLEEICQVLRSSPLDIVREMLEHTLKRLEHRNPIVKQKTLRFVKYAAGKGGADFKREMQRHAGVIKSYFHYKGQLDALKGDALNKAVRDTAHEAVVAIFCTEETTSRMEDVGKRIQGFGSSNYDSRPREEEKKSVLTELVGFGSQTIKQSLEKLQNYNHYSGSGSGNKRNSFSGTFRSQGLRRSLTAERERSFQKEEREQWNVRDEEESDAIRTSSSKDNFSFRSEVTNGSGNHEDGATDSTVESRLLDSLTTPGGIRLHPTRETLQAFTTAAQSLDAANLVNSLEIKLKAHNWQVRFKALCLIEASTRQREGNKVLDSLIAMFEEDASAIVDSLQSPQATLRDKAKKVMETLEGGVRDVEDEQGLESGYTAAAPSIAELPNLLDTADFDLTTETSGTTEASKQELPVPNIAAKPGEINLFGDWGDEPAANVPVKGSEADPFAGMSFHSSDNPGGSNKESDLFSGLDMDSGRRAGNGGVVLDAGPKDDAKSLFDELSATPCKNLAVSQDNLVDLMGGLATINGTPSAKQVNEHLHSFSSIDRSLQQQFPLVSTSNNSGVPNSPNMFAMPQPQRTVVQSGLFQGSEVTPQMYFIPAGIGQLVQGFPRGVSGRFSANVMLQPGVSAGPVNYPGVNAAFTQQQYSPAFSGVSSYGGLQTGNSNGGGLQLYYPDNFDFSGDPGSRYASVAESMKKEDTKAFDFISDHVSSQLGPKQSR